MKAITLYQPWASLIAEGVKTIETRPKRSPWRSAIGQTIAVHAAKHPEHQVDGGRADRWYDRTVPDELQTAMYARGIAAREWTVRGPSGAVVATCTLVDVVPMMSLRDEPAPPDELDVMDDRLLLWRAAMPTDVSEQRPFGDYAPGRWALLLDDVRKCAPFPCRGHQGLWTLPDDVVDNLVGWAA